MQWLGWRRLCMHLTVFAARCHGDLPGLNLLPLCGIRLVNGRPDGPALTRLEKLRGALRAHMPPEAEEAATAWLDGLTAALTA